MENISVSVRVRPLNRQEGNEFFAWKVDGNSIVQLDQNTRDVDRTRDTKYGLDHVFGPDWTTEQIYEVTTQSLIHKMVSGFNSTVFAYGQTSSGKTHTMRGVPDSPGIVPLAVAEAFRLIESNETREFLIRVSYMELYNEEVNDLLAPENMKLPIHESKENGPYVCGLREDIVTSPEQVLQLLESGEANRHIGSTKMNDQSSRSHTIFRMVVESRAVNAESDDAGAVLVSVLTLVDLAGSERVAKTGAEGIRMKEGTAINKSLLTLGNVINKLSEGALATGGHIPYRDSKLTRILQPSLGGNAKTAIICAMTPAGCHLEESHSTLRFACRAKRVVNNAMVNEVLSDAAVLKRQGKEIEELKRRLAESGLGVHVEEQINVLRAQLLRSEQEKELMRVKLQEEQHQREKAQKQAEVAKKLMFQQRDEPAEGTSRKQNRRETWCPGKSAWAAPMALAIISETPTQSGSAGGGEPDKRKRSFGRLDGALPSKSNAELSVLFEEEDEEEGDVAEGPTPQRRRRDRNSVPSDELLCSEDEEDGSSARQGLERIMASLPSQERQVLNRFVQQFQDKQERLTNMRQALTAAQAAAAQHEETGRTASEALDTAQQQKEALNQQLEQVKWQSRQLDKKVEELQTACRAADKEREALAASSAAQQAGATDRYEELGARHKDLSEAHTDLKDKVKALKAELSDTRAKLEMRDYEAGLREAKDAANAAHMGEASAKLREKVEELEALRRSLKLAEERTGEAEGRARELYECNKRLEVHVGELESRKRAPLYQKKQEEELKAFVEKAQECEVRAIEAELRAKELQMETEAAQKRLTEVQEEMTIAARQATRDQEELAERHGMEVQRLTVESARQQERHDEALGALRTAVEEAEEAKSAMEATLQAKEQKIAEMQQEAETLQERINELEASEAELQAYTTAAQEKITLLEHNAEEETAAHDVALAERQRAHDEAVTAAQTPLEAAKAALTAELVEAKASAATAVAQLEGEVRSARERAELLVKASLDQSQEAATSKAELQRQVDELSAKVQEAAGALKAKEELKEERLRSKQEIANLKGELQKLQLETKTGAKGKDMAQKELDAVKKRLTDAEAKLRVALQDKAAAQQEKANLDRQLKQNQGQKLMMEKTLEKKDVIESKKRESIMVNLNKSKEQINTFEERLKLTTVELQKVQMDLMAKKSECNGLEEQLQEQQTESGQLREENGKLSIEGTELRHKLECLAEEHKDVAGQLQFSLSELESLKSSSEQQAVELARVQSELTGVLSNLQQRDSMIETLRTQHELAAEQLAAAQQQVERLTSECTQQQDAGKELAAALEAAHSAVSTAEAARGAAVEAERSTSKDAADMRSRITALEEQEATMCSNHAATQALLTAAEAQLAELNTAHGNVIGRLEAMEAASAALQTQLEQGASSQAQLTSQLSAAGAEVQQLTGQLSAVEEQVQQNMSRAVAAEVEAQRVASLLGAAQAEVEELNKKATAAVVEAARLAEQASTAEAEVQRLAGSLSVAQMEAQQLAGLLAAAQQAASAGNEELVGQLCGSQAEVQRLSNQLAAADAEVQQLRAQAASLQEAAASTAQQAAGQVATAQEEAARLQQQLDVAQQVAATDAEETSARLVAAQEEVTRLHQQLGSTQQSSATVVEEVRSQLAAAQAAAQELSERLEAVLGDATAARQQAAAAAGQASELHLRVRTLEEQLAHQDAGPLPAATPQHGAGTAAHRLMEDDTADLLDSPVERRAPEPALSAQPGADAAVSSLMAALEQLRAESAAEIESVGVALAAAALRTEVLEAELAAVRRQLHEAQSAAAMAGASASDVTRSLTGASITRLQITELQQQLDQLSQELKDAEFARDEDRAAAASEQQQLKARLATADTELTNERQQVVVLQQRCVGLEEVLVAAQRSSAEAAAQVGQLQAALGTVTRAAAEAEAAKQLAQGGTEGQTQGGHAAELAAQRDALEVRLSEALAAQEELAREVSLQVEQREQLEHVIDELSVRLAAPADADVASQELQRRLEEQEQQLQAVMQDAQQLSTTKEELQELQRSATALQVTVEEQAARLQQLAATQQEYNVLQQRYASLAEQHAATEHQLAGVVQVHAAAAAAAGQGGDGPSSGPAEDVAASATTNNLGQQLVEMQQRQVELESEMSDVQAACNVARAEKHTVERAMAHRVLELETANIRLQDQLSQLRGEGTGGSSVNVPESAAPSVDMDAVLAERDQLQARVRDLSAALENATTANEQIGQRLGSELEALRAVSAAMEADVEALQQARQTLEADKTRAEAKALILQEALDGVSAAHRAADGDASSRASEAEAALSALLLRYDELAAQREQLQKEVEAKAGDVEALRVGLAQELDKCKAAERQGEELSSTNDDLRSEVQRMQDTVRELTASNGQASERLAVADGAAAEVQQLQLQVSSLKAAVTRLTAELVASKEETASSEAEVSELLDGNTLLQSQLNELRASHAALQSRAASDASAADNSAAAAALATQLRGSEALRSKLEVQVLELTEQMSTASEQRRAAAHERAEMEGALTTASDAKTRLEANMAALEKACKELREENRGLEDDLAAAQEQLRSFAGERPSVEQLSELQSQLQLQENRHRLASEQLQAELAAMRKRLAEEQQASGARESELQRQLDALTTEMGRRQEAQVEMVDELELSAKQREAELNAEKLSLESQIHWLTEENQRLQEGGPAAAPAPPPPSAEVMERVASLEVELRRAKRGEMKLQAMLYRLRKDLEAAGGNAAAFENLRDVRSLQYDVDMLTEKCKRFAREAQQHEADKRQLEALMEQQHGQQQGQPMARGGGGKVQPMQTAGGGGGGAVLVDKENMPYR